MRAEDKMTTDRKPDRTITFGIEGIVKSVELVNAKTGVVERRIGSFKNLITDAALDAIGNSGNGISALVQYLAVGTDNTPPVAGQTSLGAQLGSRYSSNGGFNDVSDAAPDSSWLELSRTRVIPENDGNGNLTELGFFSASTGGTMWCRQLFLDDVGNPTTITKLNSQQLRVTYAWRLYPSITPITDSVTIDGTATDCDARAMEMTGWAGLVLFLGEWGIAADAFETNTFPSLTSSFAGTKEAATSSGAGSYTPGNFYRDVSVVWDPGFANFATGIGAVAIGLISGRSAYKQLGTTFTPKVPKGNTDRFTYVARVSWGRA